MPQSDYYLCDCQAQSTLVWGDFQEKKRAVSSRMSGRIMGTRMAGVLEGNLVKWFVKRFGLLVSDACAKYRLMLSVIIASASN